MNISRDRLFFVTAVIVIGSTCGSVLRAGDEPDAASVDTTVNQKPQKSVGPIRSTESNPMPDIDGVWWSHDDRFVSITLSPGGTDFYFSVNDKNNSTGLFRFNWPADIDSFLTERNRLRIDPFVTESNHTSKLFRLKWSSESNSFLMEAEGFEIDKMISVNCPPGGRSLIFKTTLSDADLRAFAAERGTPDASRHDLESVLTFRMTRYKTLPSSQSARILLVETPNGLAAFSKADGTWARIATRIPENGASRIATSIVSNSFATVSTYDRLYAFTADTGTWRQLNIPEALCGKYTPVHGSGILELHHSGTMYVFSPKSGNWTSAEGDILGSRKVGVDSLIRAM